MRESSDEVAVDLHFGSIVSTGLASPGKKNVANPLDALVASHYSKVVVLLPVLVDERVLLLSVFGIGDERKPETSSSTSNTLNQQVILYQLPCPEYSVVYYSLVLRIAWGLYLGSELEYWRLAVKLPQC